MPRKKQPAAVESVVVEAPPPVAHDFEQMASQTITEKSSADIVVLPPPPEDDGRGLFDDLDDEAEAVAPTLVPYTRPDDGIVMDAGLTPSEKAEFVRLLNIELPLRVRAIQLAKLAMYTDTKRAAVGLRAIQEINAITGVSGNAPADITPMFALPADTRVNVTVTKVVK